jgi:hypothetical protein
MEHDLPSAASALNRAVRGAGLSGIAFTRALLWTLTGSGDLRVLVAEPGLIGYSDTDFAGIYHAVAGDEPLDLQFVNWWTAGGSWVDPRPARMIFNRDILTRYYRTGVWVKGADPVPPQRVTEDATRFASMVADGTLQVALTDAPLGELNLIIGEGEVLLESSRYRATDDDRARLGMLVRGSSGVESFARRYDQLWDSIPEADKNPEAVAAWLREQASAVGAGRG